MTSCAVYGCVACAVDGGDKCAVHKKHDSKTVYEPLDAMQPPLLVELRKRLEPIDKIGKPFRGAGVDCPGCDGTGSLSVDCEGCNGNGWIPIDDFLDLVEAAIAKADDLASKTAAL